MLHSKIASYSSKDGLFVPGIIFNFGFHLFLLHFGEIKFQEEARNLQIFQLGSIE